MHSYKANLEENNTRKTQSAHPLRCNLILFKFIVIYCKNNKVTTYYATCAFRKIVTYCKNNEVKTCYATYPFRKIFLQTTS